MWNDGHAPGTSTGIRLLAARAGRGGAGGGGPGRPVAASPAALVGRIDALRSLAVFRASDEAALAKLAEASSVRRLKRRQALDHARAKDHLVAIVRGYARTSLAHDGLEAELIVDILGAGGIVADWCWGNPAFATNSTVVALEDAVVALLPRRPLESFLARDSATAVRLLQSVATAGARAVALASQNACLGVADRLYCRLVELAHARGVATPNGVVVHHGLTQSVLAAFSCASRENVNRHLNDWRSRGWIEFERSSFVVRAPEALTQAASPSARRVGFGAGDGRLPFSSR